MLRVIAASVSAGALAVTAWAQDKAQIQDGVIAYNMYCFTCHGENLVSSGQNFDLRRLKPEERERFNRAVLNGKGQMPPWRGVVKDEEIDAIWAYIMSERK